jgi:hypothetical protein
LDEDAAATMGTRLIGALTTAGFGAIAVSTLTPLSASLPLLIGKYTLCPMAE